MINLEQIRDLVVVPALTKIGYSEPAAIRLVIGTGLIETNYDYIAQVGGGPALGLWQVEPNTALDTWNNFISFHPGLMTRVYDLMVGHDDKVGQLAWNLQYAAAMCRIKYIRSPAPLPHKDDLQSLSSYWLTVYNAGGKGNSAAFMERALKAGLMDLDVG